MVDSTQEMSNQHVKNIAENIEAIVSGDMYLYKGEYWTTQALEESDIQIEDNDDVEPASLYDYLDDNYGVTYHVGNDMEVSAVEIMVACGGPNIYIDTSTEAVELYWWGTRASEPISEEAVKQVNDWAQEEFDVRRMS